MCWSSHQDLRDAWVAERALRSDVRVSDADRQATIDLLSRHTGEGLPAIRRHLHGDERAGDGGRHPRELLLDAGRRRVGRHSAAAGVATRLLPVFWNSAT